MSTFWAAALGNTVGIILAAIIIWAWVEIRMYRRFNRGAFLMGQKPGIDATRWQLFNLEKNPVKRVKKYVQYYQEGRLDSPKD